MLGSQEIVKAHTTSHKTRLEFLMRSRNSLKICVLEECCIRIFIVPLLRSCLCTNSTTHLLHPRKLPLQNGLSSGGISCTK